MKVTDIILDQLLYTEPVKSQPYDSPEEEGGFFKKVFAKKKEPEVPFFNTRVEEFGRDEIYNEMKSTVDRYPKYEYIRYVYRPKDSGALEEKEADA